MGSRAELAARDAANMEARRALEEIHREIGAMRRETQWLEQAFVWCPRRLRHRVEARVVPANRHALEIVSTLDVTERIRATPDRARFVLETFRGDARWSGAYLFDAEARVLRSRAEFELEDSDDLARIVGMLSWQIDEAERQAAQFARVLAGRIPIIREPTARARRTQRPSVRLESTATAGMNGAEPACTAHD